MKKHASLLAHFRDILILPVMVTVVIPYFIDKPGNLPPGYLQFVGFVVGIAGLSLLLYTVILFKIIGRGTLAPWSPKQRLVITGPYRYCRNPMITGVFIILVGECIFFWSSALLSYLLIFFVINTIYFILVEEPGLKERFGNDYDEYKEHVPRWIPRLKPYHHF
ncbi:MAG TPA: isoprenylcysteine carboxylmethyltransferase family protein [Cyclobacteriaceae bacterium]